ncbi:MAG TPA: CRISPR system precrRNA processing endoribonuclease RAMP protein Cas6 [Lamprocystis sp. (in: g-proteobacteria)]|nr:CRISPR system precrRNA processing endoribonuclease RAMP protein Cas6 [Lamprocystis sp. (in: g-proteobacteria)]
MSVNDQGRPDSDRRFPAVARFNLGLRALDGIGLPDYAGSTWRGLLGHGLRRTACVTRQPTCAGCLLIHQCVYSLIFETPPPPDADLAGFTALPHPFVLDIDPQAPRHYQPGEPLPLGITLIGAAISQVPYLIQALREAGQQGLGREHGRFTLESVTRETTPGAGTWDRVYDAGSGTYRPAPEAPLTPPPAPDRVRLRLLTPLRIKHDARFVVPAHFTLADLLRHLYNRLQRLALMYGGQPQTFDWPTATALLGGLRLHDPALRWHDWTRYSSRQHTLMQLGGLLGDLTIEGPALPDLWPVLWVGQWTHIGKGTAFGLGAYRLEPL